MQVEVAAIAVLLGYLCLVFTLDDKAFSTFSDGFESFISLKGSRNFLSPQRSM